LEAFSLRPIRGLVLAAADGQIPLAARGAGAVYETATTHVEADMLIWLRFPPRAYLSDWAAKWLDMLLNGAAGWRRRGYRTRLMDVARSCATMWRQDTVDTQTVRGLRPRVRLLELSSPEQALFWLEMQVERVRETEPPRP